MKSIRVAHVREPEADRLRRQARLGDLGLGDVVDQLADGLAPRRLDAEAPAHQADAEQARERGADEQVDDGLG